MVNFFVSTAKGSLNEGPLVPAIITPTSLTVDVPADITLGQGVVALQVVNTDQGYVTSNLAFALLQALPSLGVPSLTAINGVGLAATSTNPAYAVDNVETVVPQGSEVVLSGDGFDTANGIAVDVFCACANGKVGPFLINPGDPFLSANSVTLWLPLTGPDALPVGPASFQVSNRGSDGSYAKKSNAVAVPIGRSISVFSVMQDGMTLIVEGTGFSTLTVINFFDTDGDDVVNLGGLQASGAPKIGITMVSDTRLVFNVPAGAVAGPAYVQAVNPPFVPFSNSGDSPDGAFILVNGSSTPTATVGATPTAVGTSSTPTATPTPRYPTTTPSSTRSPSATPTATPAVVIGVLIAGGDSNLVSPSGSHPTLASAEIYDEATGTFGATGSMGYPRLGHTMTALNNGEILVTGGHNAVSERPMPSAELYDIQTATFSFTASMNTARLGHTALLLNDGKVLVAGGWNVDFSAVNIAELYYPAVEQFILVESLVDARMGHTATLLNDGEVLVAGGADDFGFLSSAELCDEDSGCNQVGSMSVARQFATATRLNNGTVLVAGGASLVGDCQGCSTHTAELYNPATTAFSVTGPMHARRQGHRANLLPDGRVLITGGLDAATGTVLNSAEIYDPATRTFAVARTMGIGRYEHTATTLADGKVLIAGGFDSLSDITDTAELYDPLEGIFTPTGRMTSSRAGHTAALFRSGPASP